MHFRIGERVGYLYEKGFGIVTRIEGKRIFVEDEDGFERYFQSNELVFIHNDQYTRDVTHVEKEDAEEDLTYRIVPQRTGQRKPQTVWEVDLHIEELLESHHGMSNTEILLKQMGEFRSTFKKARKQGVHKLIVIHGIGEGVLKNEIRTWLSQQEQIEVYDAEFSEYGKGATAVEFHPNWTT